MDSTGGLEASNSATFEAGNRAPHKKLLDSPMSCAASTSSTMQATPRSSCSSTDSSSWHSGSDDEDDDGKPFDIEEADRINEIQANLEAMNLASESLNAAQECLAKRQRHLRQLHQRWAEHSARLAHVFGHDQKGKLRMSEVASFLHAQEEVVKAREKAEGLSAAFMRAPSSGDDPAIAELAQRHKQALEDFHNAQVALQAVRRNSGWSKPRVEAVMAHVEAEVKHRQQVGRAQAASHRCELRIQAAKAEYAKALGRLESLSEDVHRHRASSGKEWESC